MTKILTISGSLRRLSNNSRLLSALATQAPDSLSVERCTCLADLPLFNPDLEGREPPIIFKWRAQLAACDAIVISSPEYAHGVTGVIKNALDWVVGSGEFVGKPVAVLNAAPRSSIAYEALKEILRTMDAQLIDEASLDIPVLGSHLDEHELVADPVTGPLIRTVMGGVCRAAEERREKLAVGLPYFPTA